MSVTPANQNLANLQAFELDKTNEELMRDYGVSDIVKLASNENPLGCSPHIAAAVTEKLGELSRYPDGAGFALKQAIAKFYEVSSDNIVLGNGSNEILNLLIQTYVTWEDTIVYAQHAFSHYELASLPVDVQCFEVPVKHFSHDLPAMLEAVRLNPNTKLVYIGNPNNPTGTYLDSTQIRKFVKKLPSDVLVVIDEAFIELTNELTVNDNLTLIKEFDNVVILRTFSKAYGLAGLRIGYAICQAAVADILNRTRQAFNTNVLAQAAATAALNDQQFIQAYRDFNDEQREALCKGFDSLGLAFIKSVTNFVMVNVGDSEQVYRKLLEQGVVVRPLVGYGLPEWIRVSVGLPEENLRFLDTLEQVLS